MFFPLPRHVNFGVLEAKDLYSYTYYLIYLRIWENSLSQFLFRIFFIPLFMICNAVPESRYYTPILIYSDTAYILLIFILSISNGYMTGIVMVSAPYRVPVHLKQTAANFMAGILGVGLAAGAAISSAAVQLL